MFIVQPSSNFGELIGKELDSTKNNIRQWSDFEFAVAWVNYPGITKVIGSMKSFLAEGGCIRATVGLDFSSTSYEGLSCLLGLEGEGNIKTHVFFDENKACTFHPKVFLFTSQHYARLFVGSNNMTGAGLDTNVEVALAISGSISDDTINNARATLAGWRDVSVESRTRHLTPEFLDELLSRGYVRTEEEIRNSRQSEINSIKLNYEPLFGRSRTPQRNRAYAVPSKNLDGSDAKLSFAEDVLLMRVKPRRNGNQIQISMKVYEDSFIGSTAAVVSAADNKSRLIGFNFVNRNGIKKRNTARFEAPELMSVSNPIVRFRWVGESIKVLQYEVFDGDNDVEGIENFKTLSQGIANPPNTRLEKISSGETVLSKSIKEDAQWYRIIKIGGN